MKRLLSIIGSIALIGTNTTSLVACDNISEYTPEELTKLKEENKINTTNQEIKDNLEWIAPQEKPFNTVDNKWYYVVWRGNTNDNWFIVKFNNDKIYKEHRKMLDKKNNMELYIGVEIYWGYETVILFIVNNDNDSDVKWNKDNGKYFKAIYRWNLDNNVPDLDIYTDGNIKVK
ncbi:lipoprotein [Spiroplasma sp. Moj]|uniref:lipoprotein n=1 Tax=Spiroplasma sp. Moj TaxID=1922342 RepID=UPI0039F0BE6C|nr:hypothetical protein [Spiroplasma sp. Moj]